MEKLKKIEKERKEKEMNLVFGMVLGLIFATSQYKRLRSGANRMAMRHSDGSVYGGLWPSIIGVFILWLILGFLVSMGVTYIFKLIF